MDARSSGGLLACEAPGDPLKQQARFECKERPGRAPSSTFGSDEDLGAELPPQWSLRKFQEQVKAVLKEYFVSLAVEDTISQVRELLDGCASEADELGVLAIRAALDRDTAAHQPLVDLLQGLHGSSVLDRSALIRSFEKLFSTWEDITIDAPTAPEALLGILQRCIAAKVMDHELLPKLPESLLKAGIAKAEPAFRSILEGVATRLKEFKRKVATCLEEYFVALNVTEVGTFLLELAMQPYHHEFVKKVVTLSFSQGDVETSQDAALSLLAHLTAEGVVSKDDLQWGVTRLLGQLEDLELDCPRCSELATQFLSSMVADELVSVPFLRRCRLLRIGGAAGLRVLDATQRRTPEYKRHLGTAQFKSEIQTMILEFFNSGDEAEFGRCVCELAPLSLERKAELVRKVMALAIERSGSECEMALRLLVVLCRHEEIDGEALARGFDELYTRMPDLQLDVPDAEDMARTFVVEAKKAKILHETWPEPLEA